ncbi:hypothetical protein CPC08DRAFT_364962 [Agrocybe pediades]|nr:hypothetical protein CPC08DRAFT_364962 [Agrocybe pediades]
MVAYETLQEGYFLRKFFGLQGKYYESSTYPKPSSEYYQRRPYVGIGWTILANPSRGRHHHLENRNGHVLHASHCCPGLRRCPMGESITPWCLHLGYLACTKIPLGTHPTNHPSIVVVVVDWTIFQGLPKPDHVHVASTEMYPTTQLISKLGLVESQ